MTPRDAYKQSEDFVAACATAIAPTVQSLEYRHVPDLPASPELRDALSREFGSTERLIPLAANQIGSALQFLEEIDPQPQNQWGMAAVSFRTVWNIAIIDPISSAPFPGQGSAQFSGLGYNNRLTLHVSNRASIELELCIPDLDDDRLHVLLPVLQANAPFKFSTKHWRRWTSTRNGAFVSRKINLA